jgi:phage head maturation protease
VLPSAKPEQRYALRMIANALGIATRELESHDANTASEARGLDALYRETQNTLDLHLRNRQFAQDIRRGAFETSSAAVAALRQHLTATARAKLAAAYPKGLSALN